MFCALRQAAYGIIAIRQTGESAKILSKMPAEEIFLGLFNCEQKHTYAPIIYYKISQLKCNSPPPQPFPIYKLYICI